MASGKIRGITLEIDGDTSGFSKALKSANSEISTTQKQLKDVDKLLKLDPTNTELLRQKQQLLAKQVEETKNKLDALKDAQKTMDQNGVDKNSEQYMALQREILATENKLKDLETAANNSNVTLQKVSAVTKQVADKTGELANKTQALSTAAAGALTGLVALGYNAATSADDLNTLAKQTGFSTEALQKMEYAADLIDVNVSDMTGAIKKLKKNITSNSTDIQEAFAKIGVSVTDVNGEFKDSEDLFFEVAQGLSTITNETERDNLAMQIFGKSADSLAGVIDDGGAALREYGEEAEKMGGVLSQDTLDGLNEVNDQIDVMKMRIKSVIAQNGAKILEVITPLIDKLGSGIEKVATFLSSLSTEQLEMIMIALSAVAALSPLLKVISAISTAISFLTSSVLPTLSSAISFIISNPIALVIAAIVAIVALIATKGDEIKEILSSFDEWLQNVFAMDMTEIFGPVLGDVLNGFLATVKNIWDSVKQIFDGIIDFIRGVFTGDWQRAWNGVKEIFSGIFNAFLSIAKAPLNGVIGLINGVISGLNALIKAYNNTLGSISGWHIGSIGKIPYLANGGILSQGSAVVGEAGPELLTMAGNKAVVQPLSGGRVESLLGSIDGKLGSGSTKIIVQSVLDGRVIGETAYQYNRSRSLAYGN